MERVTIELTTGRDACLRAPRRLAPRAYLQKHPARARLPARSELATILLTTLSPKVAATRLRGEARQRVGCPRFERHEGKLSRGVPRGQRTREGPELPSRMLLLQDLWQVARSEDPRGNALTLETFRDEVINAGTCQINA